MVCEATGGYEGPMVEACHEAKILVSVLNPARHQARQPSRRKTGQKPPVRGAGGKWPALSTGAHSTASAGVAK
jgi:hypothetical protein